jgi:xanthine dehydrogenase accessory factor
LNPVWSRIAATIADQGRAALVTVAAVSGSAPREPGARMVVRPDGGFWGTIGGGALEWAALADAREALAAAHGSARVFDRPLGPDLGQCCGGRVTTLVEVFAAADLPEVAGLASLEAQRCFETHAVLGEDDRVVRTVLALAEGVAGHPHPVPLPSGGRGEHDAPHPPASAAPGATVVDDPAPPKSPLALEGRGTGWGPHRRGIFPLHERFGDASAPVLLFGAGHVGRALALALAPLPFRVRWVDTRADAFPRLVPANATPVHAEDAPAEASAASAGTLVMVMTHSHPLDLAVVEAALRRDDLGGVGLIGSATKRARFLRRLREAGLPATALARLTCPVGVPGIGGREPAVIAASVAAQLLLWREEEAARHGAGTPQIARAGGRR